MKYSLIINYSFDILIGKITTSLVSFNLACLFYESGALINYFPCIKWKGAGYVINFISLLCDIRSSNVRILPKVVVRPEKPIIPYLPQKSTVKRHSERWEAKNRSVLAETFTSVINRKSLSPQSRNQASLSPSTKCTELNPVRKYWTILPANGTSQRLITNSPGDTSSQELCIQMIYSIALTRCEIITGTLCYTAYKHYPHCPIPGLCTQWAEIMVSKWFRMSCVAPKKVAFPLSARLYKHPTTCKWMNQPETFYWISFFFVYFF